MEQKDAELPSDIPPLCLEKHIDYIANYGKKTDDLDYLMSEHLRMSGIYWCLTGMVDSICTFCSRRTRISVPPHAFCLDELLLDLYPLKRMLVQGFTLGP